MITIDGKEHWNNRGLAALAGAAPRKAMEWMRANGFLTQKNTPTSVVREHRWAIAKQGKRWGTLTTYWTEDGMKHMANVLSMAVERKEIPAAKKRKYTPEDDPSVKEFWGEDIL